MDQRALATRRQDQSVPHRGLAGPCTRHGLLVPHRPKSIGTVALFGDALYGDAGENKDD